MTEALQKTISFGYSQVGGVQIHYAKAGNGPRLVVLLHGFPEFWYAWRDVLPALGADFHAVAPDLRGFNLSSKPAAVADYRIGAVVGDLIALIRALGHERATVVGHDWGGAAAWTMAIAQPQLVERLMILNSPHPVLFARALASDRAQQEASEYMNWLRAAGSEQLLAENDFERLAGFFLRMGGNDWFDAVLARAYRAAWTQPGALAGGVNYYRATPLHPPTATEPGAKALQLRSEDFTVRVPTRVIWGELDSALLTSLLDGLDELVPELSVLHWPQASHWLIHEYPARVAAAISEFAARR